MQTKRHYRPAAISRPAAFRRPRVLIVGCGDVGLRLARSIARGRRVVGTSRRGEQAAAIRASGARALNIDLDDPAAVRRVAGLADLVVVLSPPPAQGRHDPRVARLLAALGRRHRDRDPERKPAPVSVAYVSTTGVYGDCAGAEFDETRAVAPASDRAVRRVDAERRLRAATRRGLVRATLLRAPGIYAGDRLPVERLRRGTPALRVEDDVFTNHIHADDLARLCWLALLRGAAGRVYHAVDDSDMRMADYFDAVADALGLARPPRLSREEVAAAVTPAMLSFMSESRRLANRRIKRELRVRLRYPTIDATLGALSEPPGRT